MRDIPSRILLAPGFQKLSYRSAIAFYVLIVVIGSLPGAREDIAQYASGVVLHSLAYAILAFLLFAGSNGNRVERAVKSALAVMAMGAFDEYVQSFFPYRTAAVTDWMLDAVAAIVTSAMLLKCWPRPTDSD